MYVMWKNNVLAKLKMQMYLSPVPENPLTIPKYCLLRGPLNKRCKGAIRSMLYTANEITDKSTGMLMSTNN